VRRPPLLLAASLVAVGLLAGCDLPGGTPPAAGSDRAPNDTRQTAQVVEPTTFRGTLGPLDTDDWFELATPSVEQAILQECLGGTLMMSVLVENEAGVDRAVLNNPCDDDGPHINVTTVKPGERAFVHFSRLDQAPITDYAVLVEYRSLDDPVEL
jgi:hypothetical protein